MRTRFIDIRILIFYATCQYNNRKTIIDTHAHIDDKQFDTDRAEVLRRAFQNGVEKIVTIGAGLGSSERAVKAAGENENLSAVVGCHPEYFMRHGSWKEEHKKKLEELARSEKVVAIGEIGLEYHSHDGNPVTDAQKEFQKEGFIFQLELAKELNLPVVIHCRGERAPLGEKYREVGQVYEDVLEILKKWLAEFGSLASKKEAKLPFVVFHSFGGRLDFARKVMERENILFSFNGNLTYAKPKAEILEVVRTLPLEKIMLETDCPYLAPVPNRGTRNEPSYVKFVRDAVAEIKQISADEVERVTTENAIKFFGLK